MKRFVLLLLCCMMVVSLAACGNEESPQLEAFDSSINEAVPQADSDAPSSQENNLPDDVRIRDETDATEKVDQVIGGPEIVLEDMTLSQITVDTVKEWFVDAVGSEYVTTESDNGLLVAHTATLKNGGTITISTYADTYYNTAFTYKDSRDEAVLYEQSVGFLRTYLARGLTDDESSGLRGAIASALKGGSDVVYIKEFGTTPIYVSVSDTAYSLICS